MQVMESPPSGLTGGGTVGDPRLLGNLTLACSAGTAGKQVLPRSQASRSGTLFRREGNYAMPMLVQKRCRNAAKCARVAVPLGFRAPPPVPWTIPLPTAQLMASWA